MNYGKAMVNPNRYEIGSVEWLRQRQEHITGSDGSIIEHGMNAYGKTVCNLYADKKAKVPPTIPDNRSMVVGRILEDVLLSVYSRVTKTLMSKPLDFFENEDWRVLGANIDGIIESNHSNPYLIEIKTTVHPEKWQENYTSQCTHLNMVFDAKATILLVFNTNTLKDQNISPEELVAIKDTKMAELIVMAGLDIHTIERDPGREGVLMERYKKFWNCMATDTEPDLVDYGYNQINLLDSRVAMVVQYEKLNQVQKYFDSLKAEVYSFIKDNYPAQTTPDYSISNIEGGERFDEAKFKEENPAMYQMYMKPSAGYKRIYIKKSVKTLVNEWMEKHLEELTQQVNKPELLEGEKKDV